MTSYTDILMHTFYVRREYWLIWVIILTVVLAANFLDYFLSKRNAKGVTTKQNKTKRKKAQDELQRKLEKSWGVTIGVCIILAVMFFTWVNPPYLDAVEGNIIEVKTEYSREDRDNSWYAPDVGGALFIKIGGKHKGMELYPGFSSLDFPEGEYHARVRYGEKSLVILDLEILEK